MTTIAEVRDAIGVLRVEHKRTDALLIAIDTVESFMQAQPALVQVEEKQARAEQQLGRVQASLKTETARLEEVRSEKDGLISATKKEIATLKAAATEEHNKALARAKQATEDTAKIVADCQAEITKERKELEAIKVEKANLAQRLTA